MGGSSGTTFGPVHLLAGKESGFFITAAGCSPTGGAASDALWFCQHFYSAACAPQPGFTGDGMAAGTMMHSGSNCYAPDPTGVGVPATVCMGGPCKIGDYVAPATGLSNLVCDCP